MVVAHRSLDGRASGFQISLPSFCFRFFSRSICSIACVFPLLSINSFPMQRSTAFTIPDGLCLCETFLQIFSDFVSYFWRYTLFVDKICLLYYNSMNIDTGVV